MYFQQNRLEEVVHLYRDRPPPPNLLQQSQHHSCNRLKLPVIFNGSGRSVLMRGRQLFCRPSCWYRPPATPSASGGRPSSSDLRPPASGLGGGPLWRLPNGLFNIIVLRIISAPCLLLRKYTVLSQQLCASLYNAITYSFYSGDPDFWIK
jgi:hypothetical protein